MSTLKRRLSALEEREGAVTLHDCLHFVDQMALDFPDIAPTTQEARQRIAKSVQRCGGPVAYMRSILDEIDGTTAHMDGGGHVE